MFDVEEITSWVLQSEHPNLNPSPQVVGVVVAFVVETKVLSRIPGTFCELTETAKHRTIHTHNRIILDVMKFSNCIFCNTFSSYMHLR